MARPRILLVDDDREIAAFLELLLDCEGFALETAPDGRGLASRIAAAPPDLILLDATLPDCDGIELCRSVKRDRRLASIPVFVVSGVPGDEIARRATAAGAAAFLRKPFENAELVRRIRNHLEDERRLG